MLDKMKIVLSYSVLAVDFYLNCLFCTCGLELNHTRALSGGGFAQAVQFISVTLLLQCDFISIFQVPMNTPIPGSKDDTKLIFLFLLFFNFRMAVLCLQTAVACRAQSRTIKAMILGRYITGFPFSLS